MISNARADGAIVSVGSAYAPESATDGHSWQTHTPLILRGGYAWQIANAGVDTYLEYQQFNESDGLPLLSVARKHRELSVWARHRFFEEWYASPYVAVGAGVSSDVIKTSFNQSTSTATQDPELLLGLALGANIPIYRGLEAQIEARMTAASSFIPDPLFQAGIHLGYRF